MVLEINRRSYINLNRFISLFFLLIVFNCSNNKSERLANENNKTKIDSLEITISNIPKKTETGFNYIDSENNSEFISFYNDSENTKSITKRIKKIANYNYSLTYRSFSVVNNKNVHFYHDYIINQDTNKVSFIFDTKNGDIKLSTFDGNVVDYNDIIEAYEKIATKKGYLSVNDKIRNTENLFSDFQKKLTSKDLLAINETIFYKQLSMLLPGDKRIDNYLKNIANPIWSFELSQLMYYYLQHNKDYINTFDLDKNKNKDFNNLLVTGVFSHLQQNKEKQYPAYKKNLSWFKETNYYKDNKNKFDKMLVHKENLSVFQNSLFSFDLYENNKVVNLKTIINNKQSDYYLLDFWATWCIPCLENIQAIHKMELPKGLEIIYVSMDRVKDKEKWLKKAESLHLSNSYLSAETQNNKNIINKINLNKLPRYIIIDKDLNVLNPDLYSPQEADFLKELNTYIK